MPHPDPVYEKEAFTVSRYLGHDLTEADFAGGGAVDVAGVARKWAYTV